MQENRELLTLVAFGAAIILGLSGAPLWIAAATGVVYGAEKLGLPAIVSGRHAGDQGSALEQTGQAASRIGAILLAYGATLGLRFVGTTWA
jgi:hypothetical protein